MQDWMTLRWTTLLARGLVGVAFGVLAMTWPAETVTTLVKQHQSGVANHSERLWSLVNLEMWFRRFIDGEVAAKSFESVDEGVLATARA